MSSKELNGIYQPLPAKVIHYGSGTVQKHLIDTLPTEKSKAFIITGQSLATKTDLIKQVENLLGGMKSFPRSLPVSDFAYILCSKNV